MALFLFGWSAGVMMMTLVLVVYANWQRKLFTETADDIREIYERTDRWSNL